MRTTLALGLLVAVIAGVMCTRGCQPDKPERLRIRSRLDVAAFRVALADKFAKARTIAARSAARQRGPIWASQGAGPLARMGTTLTEPQCMIGPRELCTILGGLIHGCDGGDAGDCIALGEYLGDTPPRAAVAIVFFIQACRIGDPAGCERVDAMKTATLDRCPTDPIACSFTATLTADHDLHDAACSFGAGDSCSWMAWFHRDDLELSRAYLETACQLGLSLACGDLGHRLQPDCVDQDNAPCFAPDPMAARPALAIGCGAGWGVDRDCERI